MKTKLNNIPLRKVIELRELEYSGIRKTRALLECGHLIPCSKDQPNTERRGCCKCKLGHPKDVG